MFYFAVFATRRADWSEYVVALETHEEAAHRVAQKVMGVLGRKFLRCRVRLVELTKGEVLGICRLWGRLDAMDGEPLLPTRLPREYAAAYCQGFHEVKQG